MGSILRTRKAFTLVESAIGIGIMVMVCGLIVASIQWFRYSMSLISSVDQEAQLIRLPRILQQELQNAREIIIPDKKKLTAHVEANHQLVFKDHSGDLSIVFLDPKNRLVQYSHSRGQFRDLVVGVRDFKIWHPIDGLWNYQIVLNSEVKEESVFGSFQPYNDKL